MTSGPAAVSTQTPALHTLHTLHATPLTATAFAPYGWVIEAGQHAAAPRAVNGGSSQRHDTEGALQLQAAGGAPCVAVFRAQARDPAGPWRLLERHRLGTQTFVPLGGARCVVLVALDASGTPDPATLAAFVASGQQGFTLHAGTWHHGLLALDAGDWVVLERSGAAVDCDEATLPVPVSVVLPGH